jgi:hypothetical protein
MRNRSCPLCFVKLPSPSILARSDDLICPSCHSALEVSRRSRVFAAFLGVIAAFLGAEFAVVAVPKAAWFLALVVGVLVYGMVSALVLYFVSDLVVQPKPRATAFPHAHE